MATANLTIGRTQTVRYEELVCSPNVVGGLEHFSISLSAVHIFLSITAFLGNALILVALHKESSLHPPSKLLLRCLATTDLCVGLLVQPLYATYQMFSALEDWSLCQNLFDACFITSYALCLVSLLTLTAISVNRLLALLLGLRYRQVVTLKRTYVIVATFWMLSCLAALCSIIEPRITYFYGFIVVPSCLIISVASYAKIFHALSHGYGHVKEKVQQQPSQPSALNMARYRKAVYSALWMQLGLVVCYSPYFIEAVLIAMNEPHSSHVITVRITSVFVYLNSTLNPFLYCWKISEVRKAVKQTIRQAICCPWS